MQEKKEPPYLIIFLLLSLLIHLGLVYRYRAWQPATKALEELRRKQKDEIPVQIVELPPKEKKEEAPKPPPKKPTLLADRNQQSKTDTRTDASAPKTVRVKPVPKPKPTPQKPTKTTPKAKPEAKVLAKPRTKPESQPSKVESAIAKPRPQSQAPVKKEKAKEIVKERPEETRPEIKKLFPSFEELTKITEEQQNRPLPPGKQSPRLPSNLKRGTEISLNTLDYKFHSYYLALKRKIELVWEYPYKARQTGVQGRLLMRFVINQDGSLAEVKILRSSGVTLLDHEAVRAIQNASPFPPLPARMNTERLSVTATFEYLLTYRSVH